MPNTKKSSRRRETAHQRLDELEGKVKFLAEQMILYIENHQKDHEDLMHIAMLHSATRNKVGH